jgi:hypothetical protein
MNPGQTLLSARKLRSRKTLSLLARDTISAHLSLFCLYLFSPTVDKDAKRALLRGELIFAPKLPSLVERKLLLMDYQLLWQPSQNAAGGQIYNMKLVLSLYHQRDFCKRSNLQEEDKWIYLH